MAVAVASAEPIPCLPRLGGTSGEEAAEAAARCLDSPQKEEREGKEYSHPEEALVEGC